ncbi:MAG: GTPase, partial [Trichodesmium sp. St18_bin1]|nr:GTPase [Trichodesmium sp. St18_bin1]
TIDTKEAKNQFIRNKTTNQKIDQSQKIENKNGNIVGNVLGDHSNIEGKIRTNSTPPKIEKYHKFGQLNPLTWIQNRQIIYYLIPVTIGICLFIIYTKLFPSSFPKLIDKIQDIFPFPRVEIESDRN